MPRFVILEHDYPELHWDFMLENESDLRTWKLSQAPYNLSAHPTKEKIIEIKAIPSFPHRLIYLDYEGPISNGRGFVKRFDHGSFEWIEQSDQEILLNLQGQKFTVQLKLLITDKK